jgi:hypothetical protein
MHAGRMPCPISYLSNDEFPISQSCVFTLPPVEPSDATRTFPVAEGKKGFLPAGRESHKRLHLVRGDVVRAKVEFSSW